MPKIAYKEINLRGSSLAVVEKANQIIADDQAQGFDLTLRQLYYQMVSRDLIPNKVTEYKKLGSIINDARLAGLIDWNAIVDRTRKLRSMSHWDSPSDIIKSAAYSFHIDKWANQDYRPEVYIEKDALIGVISGVCEENDVPYFSCRGYTSQSEMWAAGQRLLRYAENRQTPIIFHLGDHDPSGKDMTRDIQERLELFTANNLKIDRLALNFDQIEVFKPPPNPAKETDSRFQAYMAEFGDESWELDALEPAVIADLIQQAIWGVRDNDRWDESLDEEKHKRELLERASMDWPKVEKLLLRSQAK